ncbi:MAG TPA: phage major capsid protein [Gammaproteobacteria bacterium]|nr:phage major capsid protein [Gammaproteobacteria bacterium]
MPGENEILNQVHEELRNTHTQLQEYVDKKLAEERDSGDGEATAETRQMVDQLNDAVDKLQKRHDELVRSMNRPDLAGSGAGADPEAELRWSAFTKYLRYGAGEEGRAQFGDEEYRALSSASDANGGFLVPNDFESMVLQEASNAAEVRPQCQVGTTSRDTVQMGALSKPKASWGVDGVAITPQELDAGGLRIEIHPLQTIITVHNDTLQDAEADIAGEIQSAVSGVFSEMEDDAFIAGSGAQQPAGVIANAAVQNRAVSLGSSMVDSAIQALYSLKKTYRRNSTWAFNSNTAKDLRQVKDNNGQYLWQPPTQAGEPPTFLGRPLINPEGMPDNAAGAHFMVIGDFRSGYKIRDRRGLTVQRLVERYAEYRQTGILVTKRTGGNVAMAEAFVPISG